MERGVYRQFYELERDHWWFKGMRAICRSQLARVCGAATPGTLRCLDIGCGTGLWTRELEPLGPVWGLDISPEALGYCQTRGLQRLIRGSAEQLPVADASCDIVTALGLLEHLDDDAAFVDELARVCKPGGYVMLLTSAFRSLWSTHDDVVHHKRRYTKRELRRLLGRKGFDVATLSYVNAFLLPAIVGVRLVQRLFAGEDRMLPSRSPDVFRVPEPINRLLYACLWMEDQVLQRVSLPWGVGLLAVMRRNGEPGRVARVVKRVNTCTEPQLIAQ